MKKSHVYNQCNSDKKPGKRLGELMNCSSQLYMLVVFFYFSRIKVIERILLKEVYSKKADSSIFLA